VLGARGFDLAPAALTVRTKRPDEFLRANRVREGEQGRPDEVVAVEATFRGPEQFGRSSVTVEIPLLPFPARVIVHGIPRAIPA
jgi:hypothetical protein